MAEKQIQKKSWFQRFNKPLFIFFTLIAIVGFGFQIFTPDTFDANQEKVQEWLMQYKPYDGLIFILFQAGQVILAPISHYTVGLVGGFLYGPITGGLYNYIGRMIGHVAAYWIGRSFQSWIRRIFNEDDFASYQRFVRGTKETLWIRLLILFLMLFLPLFPDDEISYLVGLAGLPFKYYFWILLTGHLGGSFALSYLGAGEIKDPVFFSLVVLGFVFTICLLFLVRKLGKETHKSSNKEA